MPLRQASSLLELQERKHVERRDAQVFRSPRHRFGQRAGFLHNRKHRGNAALAQLFPGSRIKLGGTGQNDDGLPGGTPSDALHGFSARPFGRRQNLLL